MAMTMFKPLVERKESRETEKADRGIEHESLLKKILIRQETTLILVMVAIGAFAASRSSLFLAGDNLLEILRSSVIYFIIACGAALLIIGGGLGFSAGAVFTLGSLITCKIMV